MNYCDFCDKEINGLSFKCKYCKGNFCSKHRLPEDHNCQGLKSFEENKKHWQKVVKKEFTYKTHKFKPNKDNNIDNLPVKKHLFHKLKAKTIYWLKHRNHREYNYNRLKDIFFKIIIPLIMSIVLVIVFNKKVHQLNNVNFWLINLGSLLLLISVIALIIYSLKFLKEINNFVKRQQRWIKIIIFLVIAILIWQIIASPNFVWNPLKNSVQNKDFSVLVPINLQKTNAFISGVSEGINENNRETFLRDLEQYKTNPKNIKLYYGKINFEVYGGLNDYLSNLPRGISYYSTPPTTKDFILKDLNEEKQRELLLPLVYRIENMSSNKKQQADIAIKLVQEIPYDWEAFNTNNVQGRYPYEVLYDMKGVCMEKSDLLAFLLRELGFGVVIFEFDAESHRAVGVMCNRGNYNTNYCFIEATDFYPVGSIPTEYVGGVDIRGSTPEVILISNGISYN